MNKEDKLGVFLASDQAPAADPAFMARLDHRMARIRLWTQIRSSAVLAIAIAAVAFGLNRAAGTHLFSWINDLVLGLTSVPGLALATIIVVAAMYLPRILPGHLKV
jgi:hypothetical protein